MTRAISLAVRTTGHVDAPVHFVIALPAGLIDSSTVRGAMRTFRPEEIPEWKREQFLLLQAQPVTRITALVGAEGSSGGHVPSEPLWTVHCSVPKWSTGIEVCHQTLFVWRCVDDASTGTLMASLPAYGVVGLEVRLSPESAPGRREAWLERVVGPVEHAALEAESARLKLPVTFTDEAFGTFTLDRRIDRFEAETRWENLPVTLNLEGSAPEDVAETLRAARSLWENQTTWAERVRAFAVKELLPLKNDSWLEEDEAPVTPEVFVSKMRLSSITLQPDRSFEFWHSDGELFWGHAIVISGDLDAGPTDADIPG